MLDRWHCNAYASLSSTLLIALAGCPNASATSGTSRPYELASFVRPDASRFSLRAPLARSSLPSYCQQSTIVKAPRSCRRIDKSEDVVKDVVAALTIRRELERLDVAHRPLLRLDLSQYVSDRVPAPTCDPGLALTSSAPLTTTRIPPLGLLGCASIVATWCFTCEKGRFCMGLCLAWFLMIAS